MLALRLTVAVYGEARKRFVYAIRADITEDGLIHVLGNFSQNGVKDYVKLPRFTPKANGVKFKLHVLIRYSLVFCTNKGKQITSSIYV